MNTQNVGADAALQLMTSNLNAAASEAWTRDGDGTSYAATCGANPWASAAFKIGFLEGVMHAVKVLREGVTSEHA